MGFIPFSKLSSSSSITGSTTVTGLNITVDSSTGFFTSFLGGGGGDGFGAGDGTGAAFGLASFLTSIFAGCCTFGVGFSSLTSWSTH